MSSSEEYLDKLLRDMMGGAPVMEEKPAPAPEPVPEPVVDTASETVPEPVSEPIVDTVSEPEPIAEPASDSIPETISMPVPEAATEIPEAVIEPSVEQALEAVPEPVAEKVSEAIQEDVPTFPDHSEEIPRDVDTMGLVIDSAPSLSPAEEAPLDLEIADLMADIMPAFDAGLKSVPGDPDASIENADFSQDITSDKKIFADIFNPEEPAVEEPVFEEPVVEMPAAEIPVAEEPIAEEPVAEEPVFDLGSLDIPGMEGLVSDTPTDIPSDISFDIPGMDDILVDNPVAPEIPAEPMPETMAEMPAFETPAAEKPAFETPVAEEPAFDLGSLDIPGMEGLVSDTPTDISSDISFDIPGMDDLLVDNPVAPEIPAETIPETVAETPAAEEPAFDLGSLDIPGMEDLVSDTPSDVSIDIPGMEGLGDISSEPIPEAVAETPAVEEPVVEEPAFDLGSLDIPGMEGLGDIPLEPIPETLAEAPAVEETVADEPVADEPAFDLGSLDIPGMEDLVTDTPSDVSLDIPGMEGLGDIPLEPIPETLAETPTLEETTVEEPAAEESVAEETAVEEPAEEPAADEPATEEPAVAASASDLPLGIDLSELEALSAEIEEEENLPDENDIEKMLAQAQNSANEEEGDGVFSNNFEDMSLGDLLGTSNDGEVDEIGSLLDKNDRNELIDGELINKLESDPAPARNMPEEEKNEEPVDPKEAKKAEKQRQKEEKAAARKKAKEEKAAAKAAKKAKKGRGQDAPQIPGADAVGDDISVHDTDLSDVEALLAGAELAAKASDERNGAGNEGMPDLSDAPSALSSSEEEFNPFGGDIDILNDPVLGAIASNEEQGSGLDDDGRVPLTKESVGYETGNKEDSTDFEIDLEHFGEDDSGSVDIPGLSDTPAIETPAAETPSSDSPQPSAKPVGGGGGSAAGSENATEAEGEKKPSFLDKIKGFFEKITGALTESDDDDDEANSLKLSDENAQILDEMNKEGDGDKKKKKKDKKKKGEEKAEGGDDIRDVEEKPKKPKKEKKPKKAKEPAADEKPEKKLSTKKIVMVVIVCGMFASLIFITIKFAGDYSVKKAGRTAFKNEDYQACYQDLFGKNLTESEEIMFNRSECILRIRLWLREYEILADEGSEVRALDSLIQSINAYPGLYTSAITWGCLDKVDPTYQEMLGILQSKYGLSADEAFAIASEPDDIVYTRLVNEIARGKSYTDAYNKINGIGTEPETVQEPEVIEKHDVLPEEEGVDGGNFVDNSSN